MSSKSHKFTLDPIRYAMAPQALTSIQAPGQQVPLAGGALKVWSGPVYECTGLSGLSLRSSTVSKLWAHHQEALGRRLWGYQPVETGVVVWACNKKQKRQKQWVNSHIGTKFYNVAIKLISVDATPRPDCYLLPKEAITLKLSSFISLAVECRYIHQLKVMSTIIHKYNAILKKGF